MDQTTTELAARAQRGDAAAFEDLIRRYERVALSVAYSVTSNAAEAGDVVQDAFLRAWQRLADLQDPAKFGSWVCNIVRNGALDARRRAKNQPVSGVVETGTGATGARLRFADDPADELQAREERDRINQALQSLDETTRTAVVMRYFDGASSKEIGEHLNLNPAAIDMRLSRARRQLKDLLAPSGATSA